MRRYGIQFWRSAPFIRLLIPFVTGILFAFYLHPSLTFVFSAASFALTIFLWFVFFFRSKKYKWRWINGAAINLLLSSAGCLLMYTRNIEHHDNWIGHYADSAVCTTVVLQDAPALRTNSYKAIASAKYVFSNGRSTGVCGDLILYFSKDSFPSNLIYGSEIVIGKPLQPIRNTGNPGSFDYRRYCAFQDINYQVYLKAGDYLVTGHSHRNWLTGWLIKTRNDVLNIFRKWVPGQTETGVAEALLIGYRDDLDKDLVRSYSNTGVVHIIAISGLHLGMIYGLMLLILKPLPKHKWMQWAKPLLILLVLWGFSLLAGAAASILRSAVMFSFIVIGESIGRKTQMYNTLAASAFCLLVYDPYFFWDVGFQLSYTAVVSIVLFMKPVYRWFYFKNKILNGIWELNAITLSAQVLTLPVILYYFHQFPNLFLFTNFIAVPLSGLILYGELLLLVISAVPIINLFTGKLISFLIAQMNNLISRTAKLPFSVTDNIQVGVYQTVLLYFAIVYTAWWLLERKKNGLILGLVFLLLFFLDGTVTFFDQSHQHKMIVYNIPRQKAIDIITGHKYHYMGDSILPGSAQWQNVLKPSRLFHGATEETGFDRAVTGHNRSVLIIDENFIFPGVERKIPVDIIVLSGNARIYLSQLAAIFDCHHYVFDSSVPLWKIQYWKKDADSLHLRHHTVSEQGAFETDL